MIWDAIGDYENDSPDIDVFIAVANNTPCGIASAYKSSFGLYELNNLVTWPIKIKDGVTSKVKNAGKGLLNLVMNQASKHECSQVKLRSSESAVPFYKDSGFSLINLEPRIMVLSSPDDSGKTLGKSIGMKPTTVNKEVDLQELDLKY